LPTELYAFNLGILFMKQSGWILVLAGLAAATTALAYLQPADTVMTREEPVSRNKPPFPAAPGGHLSTLFEKTFLGVNVLRLDIETDSGTAAKLAQVRPNPDSISAAVIEAPEAWVHMEFLRSTSQGKFFGGIRDNLAKARRAGIITPEHEKRVQAQLPEWYGFLAKRGIKSGDVIVYWIRGTVMQTTYYDPKGTVLFNLTQENPEARRGVLGSYLAPGSDFREGLTKSVGR